ncbi:PREDICTED: endoplasmin homolog isoform X3 [Camelina sativa]|uniref:Endoplasmin homolog isoform X1 n=1 Tax=Camelina sativa TaxID=90675 RepID=A0ABM0UCB8_CAMSA|nr:PREDICTED: endoplasmin homolog isoform X1 [Camelina sativa]XP_019088211.1 PREDICTED: endoplasmin homolog isoform X3 [Camelina sativa]
MRKRTLVSVLFLFSLLFLLPDQGRKLHANAEDSSDEVTDPPKVEEKIGGHGGLSTDSDVVHRESESMSKKTLRSSAEKFEFQAEVSRLMDIIINSLYSNKDIFLRELISNASDALDKIRFLALTDKDVLGEGDTAKLEIQIKLDKAKKILSIRDRGIGMTKEDLIKNLGTIAKSGTSAFVEKMQSSGDLNLIGQFGVGFYSAYLVADYIEVISKHNDDNQYVWESKADGKFAVSEDTWNEPLGRGTEIRLHLRDEAGEYLEESKLKDLVKRYSEFINFPISLWASKEIETEVPVEEDESNDEETETTSTEEEKEEDAEDEDGEKKQKTKKVKETVYEWELLNDVKAIWLRSPKEVTEEEYTKFYHSLSKDFTDEKPMAWSHFNAEGDVEFKAVLYVPPKAPHDLYESYYNSNKANLKLYVRRVFISDEFDELLPKYLSFLKGLVDSDTLPLNVSREMLQQHSSLKTIKKKLIRKALDMIRKLAKEDPDEIHDDDKKDVEKSGENDEKKGQYTKFWNEFGKSIKLGIIEDAGNRNRLAKLLRFETTKSDGKLTSLDQYIKRMKNGQKDVFYITGSSKEQLEKSPFLERLIKKGYEVIFFTDPVDEYLMQYLMDYEDKKFQNVSKEGLKVGKDSKAKELKEAFKELTKWWKGNLASENVDDVKISNRLADTPCVVVTSKFGWSANMERIMQSQTLSDANKQAYMRGKRVLEINPRHPIIKELKDRVASDPEDESVKETAQLMYQTALIESGFILNDPKDFAARIYNSVKSSLSISPDAVADEEVEAAEEPETTEATETKSDDLAGGLNIEAEPVEQQEENTKDEL